MNWSSNFSSNFSKLNTNDTVTITGQQSQYIWYFSVKDLALNKNLKGNTQKERLSVTPALQPSVLHSLTDTYASTEEHFHTHRGTGSSSHRGIRLTSSSSSCLEVLI